MHAKDGPGPGRDRGFEKFGIEIEGVALDIDENRLRAAGADAICAGNKGMADGDDLIAKTDTNRTQRKLEGRSTAGDGADIGSTDYCRKFVLEGFDLWSLRDPSRQHNGTCRICLGVA